MRVLPYLCLRPYRHVRVKHRPFSLGVVCDARRESKHFDSPFVNDLYYELSYRVDRPLYAKPKKRVWPQLCVDVTPTVRLVVRRGRLSVWRDQCHVSMHGCEVYE